MTAVIVHDLPKKGRVYGFPNTDEQVEMISVTCDPDGEDALLVLRRLHERCTRPMMLTDFMAQNPVIIIW